jgi:hypothetical protein
VTSLSGFYRFLVFPVSGWDRCRDSLVIFRER